MLGTKVPQIRTIASTYFEDGTDLPYVQEFGVAADGIVEQLVSCPVVWLVILICA